MVVRERAMRGRTTTECPYTITAASYVLGTLDEREHAEFAKHSRGCARCRREIRELLPVVRLLGLAKAQQDAAREQ